VVILIDTYSEYSVNNANNNDMAKMKYRRYVGENNENIISVLSKRRGGRKWHLEGDNNAIINVNNGVINNMIMKICRNENENNEK
jgi:hypothetical protein